MISFYAPPVPSGAGKQAIALAKELTVQGITVMVLTARHNPVLAVKERLGRVSIV